MSLPYRPLEPCVYVPQRKGSSPVLPFCFFKERPCFAVAFIERSMELHRPLLGATRQRIIHEGIGNDAFVHVFDVVPSEGDIGHPACGRMNSE